MLKRYLLNEGKRKMGKREDLSNLSISDGEGPTIPTMLSLENSNLLKKSLDVARKMSKAILSLNRQLSDMPHL